MTNLKRGPKKIKAVIFDVGGVLALKKNFLGINGVHISVSKKLRVSLDNYLDAIDTTYADSLRGKISESKVMKKLSKNLKVPLKKLQNIYVGIYKTFFKPNKELFTKAYELKKRGYKIAVISDQWPLSKRALITSKKYAPLYKHFDEVIVSCDVGVKKPNPEIYNLTLKKLKVKPCEVLFIDNQVWNTNPAKKMGLNVITFKNNKQLFNQPSWKRLFKD